MKKFQVRFVFAEGVSRRLPRLGAAAGSAVLAVGAGIAMSLGAFSVSAAADDTSPIYRITVVQSTLPAVNYGHRSGPTQIDFRGTPLQPKAHGSATVEAKPGAVEIHAKFSDLDAPTRFGAEYLTYVLWAITPEGQTQRLGEIVTNSRDNGKLDVSTSLQSFGLLVTAEPYFAVSKPSPVVVMENVIRPDTVGKAEVVSAKYELLPRAPETVTIAPENSSNAPGQMVSQREYEAILAVYQARNAVNLAKSDGADRYAPDVFVRAEELTRQAERLQRNGKNADHDQIVMLAREAAQTAEDARTIAAKRKAEQPAAKAQ
jgi:hypothetical protein